VHSATVFARAGLFGREQSDLFGILILAAELIVFAAGACLWRRFSQRAQQVFIGVACLLMVAGLICVFLLGVLEGMHRGQALCLLFVAAITLGLGLAVYNFAWAQIFSVFGSKELYRHVIFSYLVGLLLYLLFVFMPAAAVVPLAITAIMGSAILFTLTTTSPVVSKVCTQCEKSEKFAPKRVARLLWRPVLCTAVFGFMSGLMSQISAQGGMSLGAFQQASILASLVVVGILLLPALVLSRPLDIITAYRIALPISAAGFMLLPFIWDTLFGLANILMNMGLMVVSIIVWCMLATTTAQTRLPAQVVFGGCLAVIIGARLLGKTLGFIYAGSLTQNFLSLAAVALVSIYLLSMISLLFFKGQRFTRGHEADGEGLKVVVWGEDRYRECCGYIARSANFTPREFEVLLLLGQGRSIASISQSLFVSENTIKFHIRGIYRKLGVHSKQELIDLISGSLDSFDSE
jgi:DNA-binding CsgD family transcriptional regulator